MLTDRTLPARSRTRRASLLALLALAFVAPTAARAQAPGAGEPLRLATFNIHHAEGADGVLDLDRVARVVREADVVAFQEVDVRFRARSRFVDQAAGLAKALGGELAFGGNLIEGEGQYGVAVVSRLPIVSRRNHRLPLSPGREKAEPRGVLEVTIDVRGRHVRVFATHLTHDSPADRRLQVVEIRRLIAGVNEPIILMGDLNFRPESGEYARLFSSAPGQPPPLVDAWVRVGKGPGATVALQSKSPARIDYILVSPDLAAGLEQARVDTETVASDHKPVFVTLRIPTSP
jgi:endonuclease/exonuclease/phosphatase family metal-dependent hydrolase